MSLRAISFDLFDTLVDLDMQSLPELELDGERRRGTHLELHRVLRPHSPVTLPELARSLRAVDRELRETRAEEGRELPTLERFHALTRRLELSVPSLAADLTRAHMESLRDLASTPTHHVGVLTRLGKRFDLALCSNFSHAPTARRILDESRLSSLLGPLVISEEVGFRKPRAEIFRSLLRELDLPPSQVLHVGDRLDADVAGAARLGLRTAWLTRRVENPEVRLREHDGPSPDLVIADLSELPDLLEREAGR